MGATSLVKVGAADGLAAPCAPTGKAATPAITQSAAAATVVRVIIRGSSSKSDRVGTLNGTDLFRGGQGLKEIRLQRTNGFMARHRFFPPLRWRGTFAPARRASLRPMAIACLRLVTFVPERPDRS